MGFDLGIQTEPGHFTVALTVSLTRDESSHLFLSGDSLLAWPEEDIHREGDVAVERRSMFVSEVAAKPAGLRLCYSKLEHAERAEKLLRLQLENIGLKQEG